MRQQRLKIPKSETFLDFPALQAGAHVPGLGDGALVTDGYRGILLLVDVSPGPSIISMNQKGRRSNHA
jgi:hypothetical protein